MKQYLLSIILSTLASLSLFSQERVALVEFEGALGLVTGCEHDAFTQSKSGQVAAELRLNIPRSAFDVGLQLGVVKYEREGWKEYRNHHTTLYTDYNLRPEGKWYNLFAGVGLGYGETFRNTIGNPIDDEIDEWGQHFVFAPRFGAEIYNVVRLTFEGKIISREYTYWGVTLGLTIGGW